MDSEIDPFPALPGATHRAEAPGRVNLVGDHTDYNDLPVLPVAISERVRIALSSRADGVVILRSVWQPHAPARFTLDPELPRREAGDWRNYVRAAATGVFHRLPDAPVGFEGVLTSDLPPASGLSSSSAVVVAVMLALLGVNGVDLDPLEVAALAARAERYVGTEGGGMDQAASLCGRAGYALRIDFAPLRVTEVPVPAEWVLSAVFSGATAEKSGPVQQEYNERVTSCADALDRLGSAIGPDRAMSYPAVLGHLPRRELLPLAETILQGRELRRFRHTVTEAWRVEDAVEALRDGDATTFGRLMTASHESLRTDYEVSTPLLDQLVRVALDAGARGARLTGAGFGGSVVALSDPDHAPRVESAWRAIVHDEAADLPRTVAGAGRVFRIRPSDGASFGRRSD